MEKGAPLQKRPLVFNEPPAELKHPAGCDGTDCLNCGKCARLNRL
jgi:hypothetical protein